MKKILIAGAILTVLGLAVLMGALAAVGFDPAKLSPAKFETNTYTADGAFDAIEIRTDESDVTLRPSEDGTCRVVCVEQEKVKYTVSVEDGTLKISASDRRAWYEKIGLFVKQPSVTVYLPEREYRFLTVDNSTGDFIVPEGFSFESASVAAGTGDVELTGLRAGELTLQTSTGDVKLCGVVCEGTLSVTVSTGDVRMADVRCQSLTTAGRTGAVTLENVTAEGRLAIERSTGDVRFDNSDAAEITVKTDTGSVTGTLRTEKVFIVTSDTGTVRVPDTASGGRCAVTTSTGDIRIEISSGR